MALSMKRRSQFIAANQQEYLERYHALHFPSSEQFDKATHYRAELLAELGKTVVTGCHGTKLNMQGLSPGCKICVAGSWSCLFINGRCNCDCFYCPTSQKEIGQPATNSLTFAHAEDYVAYLDRFGFSGASFSGGEPLLTPERTLKYLKAIKRHFSTKLHTWLYTNGTLLTDALVGQLADAGLDEIRFDIGATDFNLKALQRVGGAIPVVTVEIPAIPEENERLKQLLPQLLEAGVQHLNLHQLRLTPYNYPRLLEHDYRYVHGEKVTVLDSELAALEMIRYGAEHNIPLAINYCSFVYKNRTQSQAARLRNGAIMCQGAEVMTATGYIRTLTLHGERVQLDQLVARFIANSCDAQHWRLDGAHLQLVVHPILWPLIDLAGLRLIISYAMARQMSSLSYRNPFKRVELSSRQQVIIERGRVGGSFELDSEQAEQFGRYFLVGSQALSPQQAESTPWDELLLMERMEEGLQEYY